MGEKILIVGGVAGGATTATKLRRLNEKAEITIFERGEHISFANCGLPYHIGNIIENREELLLQTVDRMKERYNIDVENYSEVTGINRKDKSIIVTNVLTKEETEHSYDYLVLSPGAKPIVPPLAGLDNDNVFTLRNIPDMDKIIAYINKEKPRQATVIGAGFIGLEMAENLAQLGLDVTIVEKSNQVMAPLDIEMAKIIENELISNGVKVITDDGISAVSNQGKTVELESGKQVLTDLIILAIGVQPENDLAKQANLSLGNRGGIVVNNLLQTSDESIYALGDAIEVTDYVNGKPTMIPLAWPANRQAHTVAHHINGREIPYQGTLGTSILKMFNLTAAATGNNEKTLQRLKIPYEAVYIHPLCHAGYYPGAEQMAMKLLFDKESGTIFGAQVVGEVGVDKRIDVIATAIRGGLTVYQLQELELAYAPPYSAAKDPVNLLGYVAANVIDGYMDLVHWDEIDEIVSQGGFLVDVRTKEEFAEGNILGSINIPLDDLRDRLDEFTDKKVYITCRVGLRGYLAARILSQAGFDVANLSGGFTTYGIMKGIKIADVCVA